MSKLGGMLSALEKCSLCVLFLFGAPVLGGKNDTDTEFEELLQPLDCKSVSVIVSDPLQTEIHVNQGVKLMDQLETNERRNEEMRNEHEILANVNSYDKELDQQGPTNVTHNKELKDQPLRYSEKDIVPSQQKDLKRSVKENHKILKLRERLPTEIKQNQSITTNDPETGLKDQLSKSEGRGKKELQDRTHIGASKNFETDDVPSIWPTLQTRQAASSQAPAYLGLKKRTFKHTMSNYLSKTSSFFSRKLSTSKSKRTKSGFSTQTSLNEEELPTEPKSFAPLPPPQAPKPASPQRPVRKPAPWVPPKEPFEPFSLAENIHYIVMIPGSGEFVYDTEIQKKTPRGIKSEPQSINGNNIKDISDAMLSLNQLKEDLPNVEWVSVVVNWFGNDINIQNCEVYPAVEFRDGFTVTPEDWQVDFIPRSHAKLVSRDKNGNPRYGGTVSDGALKRYMTELHRRGYKVMLYPMLVLDTENKDWRGRLTGPPNEVARFFRDQYTRFIRHYAFIARITKAEAFIIGSEFVGLTRIRDRQGNYPAVTELVKLAKEVKQITDGRSIVTYAADWTEYHIASDGRYPLDELWGSEFIDVVGINAYFPLTDYKEPIGGYSVKDVVTGWTTGEGYYYTYDYSQKSPEPIPYPGGGESQWAWKNIENWWSTAHFYPDGTLTKWRPKSKKIWFTEFGFASVDACTTQPYVFVDASSKEPMYPRYSTKKASFNSQKVAIEGTIRKWRNSEAVEKMFLYAWDARPFPYFPVQREIWPDGVNWEMGHWVQGKIRVLPKDTRESVTSVNRSLSLPKRNVPATGTTYRRRMSGERKP